MENRNLQKEIEAVLFYKSEPVKIKELARLLDITEDAVKSSLDELEESLVNRGIVLVITGDEYSLATSPDVTKTIEKIVADELNRDISSASLEVLSIIAYKGLVTRREIEYIRGVNSSYSLRTLLVRGLIEKETSRLDERVFLYKPTTDLLLHLGVKSLSDLPEWQSVQDELKVIEKPMAESEEE